MAENIPPASAATGTNGDVPGQPFYDKARAHLKALIDKKKAIESTLFKHEEAILAKETNYLDDTPNGNIIIGFDAYTKGSGSSLQAGRKRFGIAEANRVFSRSSVSYNSNVVSLPFSLVENLTERCAD